MPSIRTRRSAGTSSRSALTEAHQIWQEYTYPVFQWAHDAGGIAGFAHMQYLDNGIPQTLSCCTPIEYPVEVALGSADFISEDVVDAGSSAAAMYPEAAISAYYRLLNTGFRPGLAAGTDYPCNSSRPPGSLLTYGQVAGGQTTYGAWIDAIANGRTVISRNGHNEFVSTSTVNGTASPGDQINLTAPGTVQRHRRLDGHPESDGDDRARPERRGGRHEQSSVASGNAGHADRDGVVREQRVAGGAPDGRARATRYTRPPSSSSSAVRPSA